MSFFTFAQLVTTFIFFSAWDKSRVKWDNFWKPTQKMRTSDGADYCEKRGSGKGRIVGGNEATSKIQHRKWGPKVFKWYKNIGT